MYMMRLVYHCKRGRCPDVVECLRFLNQIYTGDGCKNDKIYVDRMGRMDRAVYGFEVANLISSILCSRNGMLTFCYPGAAYIHPKTPAARLRPSGR